MMLDLHHVLSSLSCWICVEQQGNVLRRRCECVCVSVCVCVCVCVCVLLVISLDQIVELLKSDSAHCHWYWLIKSLWAHVLLLLWVDWTLAVWLADEAGLAPPPAERALLLWAQVEERKHSFSSHDTHTHTPAAALKTDEYAGDLITVGVSGSLWLVYGNMRAGILQQHYHSNMTSVISALDT